MVREAVRRASFPSGFQAHLPHSRATLATDPLGSILARYSDAMNPEARCRAARLCLEGSKSRNRLSGIPAWSVFFFLSASVTEIESSNPYWEGDMTTAVLDDLKRVFNRAWWAL